MTELKSFLVAIYDELSEAEMTALTHGQARRVELRQEGTLPQDMSVPVYHASDVQVKLDVMLEAEETEAGTEIHITESPPEQDSSVTFTVELFELIEERDIDGIDYDNIIENGGEQSAESLEEQSAESFEGRSLEGTGLEDRTVSEEDINPDGGAAQVETGLEAIDGIGPTLGDRLREHGVGTVVDLINYSATEVAEFASTEEYPVSPDRTATWIEEAGRHWRPAEDTEAQD